MSASNDLWQLLEQATEFTLLIGFSLGGAHRHEVQLESRRSEPGAGSNPQRAHAVVDAGTFRQALRLLRSAGYTLVAGPYVADEPGYYVQIAGDGQIGSCALRHDRRTLQVLRQIADLLAPADRGGLQQVIGDFETMLERGNKP